MTVPIPQINSGNFNLASAMSGFAIGAAATVLAFVAINPTGTPSTNTSNQAAGDNSSVLLPSDGGQITAPAVGQTKTLSNGTKLTTLSNGIITSQKMIDQPLVGGWRVVFQERVYFFGGRRQAGEVESDAADQRALVGGRGK